MRSSDPDLTTITRYLTRPGAAIPGPFGVSAAFTVGRSQRRLFGPGDSAGVRPPAYGRGCAGASWRQDPQGYRQTAPPAPRAIAGIPNSACAEWALSDIEAGVGRR